MIAPEILREVRASRAAIARDVASLREAVDVPRRVKRSIRERPLTWLGCATGAGFLVSAIRPRRQRLSRAEKKQERTAAKAVTVFGGILAILKLLIPIAKPVITAFAARRFAEIAAKLG